MAERLPEYELTLSDGITVTTRLSDQDAERIRKRDKNALKPVTRKTPAANKSRTPANKSAA
jgi:hypothetical protein